MNITQFRQKLLYLMQEKYGERYPLELKRITKNNDSSYLGICCSSHEGAFPAINTDAFFCAYNDGMTFEAMLEKIDQSINTRIIDDDIIKRSDDLSVYKDKLFIKLISKDLNSELLKNIPSMNFLDLAMAVMYYDHDREHDITRTILVNNSMTKLWGITDNELFDIARANSEKKMEPFICPLSDLIPVNVPANDSLYCLTNSERMYGAACITYPGMPEKIAEMVGGSFFLIPSSIHELLIFKGDMKSKQDFDNMVREVNKEAVPYESILSDHAYYFDKASGKFTM